jgi:SAM-dependent methyltransferase
VLGALGIDGHLKRARDRQRARRALRHDPRELAPDGLPLPPPELISQVAGASTGEQFFELGARGRAVIADAVRRSGADLDAMEAILDFGVGCGRVARHWRGASFQVYGCDYNPVLVDWCRHNLPHVRAQANKLNPPLPYGDERFDLVYALSVFTHLDEAQQLSWIAELRRVTKPGGLVLFTTHGPSFPHGDESFSTPEIAARLDRGELVVFAADHAGRNMCAALHPREWVEANMLDGFECVEYVERGAEMNGGQDLYLLRRVN